MKAGDKNDISETKQAKILHDQAMSLYEQSLAAKYDYPKKRIGLLKKAFELEKTAAGFFYDRCNLEPTRSKLFASSAEMAFQLKNYRECEQLVAIGLSGNPPEDVLEELRELFDKVNFHRHLTTKGIELSDNEFRFTLASGNEIAKGIARGDELTSRIDGIEALYARTWQRLNNKEYKGKGRISDEEAKVVQLYCRTPIAASFGIIFTIPQPKQEELFPKHSPMLPIVDEMLECIDLVNIGNIEGLKKKIPDNEYFQSFLINARRIAPDGNNVKQVGFTVYRNKTEQIHQFDRIQSHIQIDSSIVDLPKEEKKKEIKRQKLSVTGVLMVSDSPKKFIVVEETIQPVRKRGSKPARKRKVRHRIKFVTEAQKELVRDYYEEEVTVVVWKYDNDKTLEFIDLKKEVPNSTLFDT